MENSVIWFFICLGVAVLCYTLGYTSGYYSASQDAIDELRKTRKEI